MILEAGMQGSGLSDYEPWKTNKTKTSKCIRDSVWYSSADLWRFYWRHEWAMCQCVTGWILYAERQLKLCSGKFETLVSSLLKYDISLLAGTLDMQSAFEQRYRVKDSMGWSWYGILSGIWAQIESDFQDQHVQFFQSSKVLDKLRDIFRNSWQVALYGYYSCLAPSTIIESVVKGAGWSNGGSRKAGPCRDMYIRPVPTYSIKSPLLLLFLKSISLSRPGSVHTLLGTPHRYKYRGCRIVLSR